MKLVPIADNQNVLSFENGIKVFFSYRTPVAAFRPGKGWIRTEQKYSATTSKHINIWLGGLNATTVPQSEIDNLVEAQVDNFTKLWMVNNV
jgi:hypothetical protein